MVHEGEMLRPKELVINVDANGTSSSTVMKGKIAYDSTQDKLMFSTGTAWETITSG